MRLPPVLISSVVLLLAAAPSSAAWRELPSYDLPGGDSSACLRAAGDGRLALRGAGSAVELLNAGADGLAPAGGLTLGRLPQCASVGAAAGQPPLFGGGVVSGAADGRTGARPAQPTVRSLDGAPTALGTATRYGTPPVVAVAPGGAAVAVWTEAASFGGLERVFAAVRPSATAPFGPPRRLGRTVSAYGSPTAGIDDSGRAHVVWIDASLVRSRTKLATAAPGAPFATPRTLGDAYLAQSAALAVAPGGRALAAVVDGEGVALWELQPGAARFGRVARFAAAPREQLAVAVRDDGSAALLGRDAFDGVGLARRPAGGRFGPVETLLTPGSPGLAIGVSESFVTTVGLSRPVDARPPQVAVALSAAGELVATWFGSGQSRRTARGYAWRGTLAASAGRDRAARTGTALGSPCRTATGLVPLTLADGRLAVAWSDDGRSVGSEGVDTGIGDGTVHVAVPAAADTPAAPAPPAPPLRVEPLGGTRVGVQTPLRFRVSCGAVACDVRAGADTVAFAGSERTRSLTTAAVPVAAGGSAVLTLTPPRWYAFARASRDARPPVQLTACTPDGAATARLTSARRLSGRPLTPAPRILALRARRSGRVVHVSWRLSTPSDSPFVIVEAREADGSPLGLATSAVRRGGRYRATVPLGDALPGSGPVRAVVVGISTRERADAARATVGVS